jgi:hypothetical protein
MKLKLHFIKLHPVKRDSLEEDIVRSFSRGKKNNDSDVGSSHPGGGEASKGLAVRQLKWYVSWVQTVNNEPCYREHTAAFYSNVDRKIDSYR